MADVAERKKSNRNLWMLLGLLLLLLAGAAFWWFVLRTPDTFTLRFRGCDDAGKCARFTFHAPGPDYSFTLGKTTIAPVDGVSPKLENVLSKFRDDAQEGVIAAGLASRETGGGGFDNRKLSACRSKSLSDALLAAQPAAGIDAPMYRISLGRYAADDSGESGDTAIERLVVMAFIRDADEGVDLSQALKNGVKDNLPQALARALRLLDFTRYECWSDEFAVTPSGRQRAVCYAESSRFEDACASMR